MAQINTLGPVGYNPTGEYDNTHEYERLDVVYYEGSSYVATQDSIGQLPTNTEYWDCIAVGYLKQNIYDSVADMKADDTLKDGMYAQTMGYYAANDGGQSKYVIVDDDTLVDDGGLIHALNNGLKAKLIIDKCINPEQFGAYGDGIHDDTNVLNYLFQSIDSPIISKENKVYLCSDTVTITKRKNINFGFGTIKFTNNGVGLQVNMESESYSHKRFAPVIENLILDGENTTKVMYIDYAYKSNIRNIYINNFKNIGMEKYRGYEMVIDNIWFWASNQNTSSIGLLVSGNDSEFGNIFGMNCHIGVKMVGGGNHFKQIHMWLFNDTQGEGMLDGNALYEGSAMIEIAGNDRYFIDYAYFDSYQYGIKYTGYGQVYLNSGTMYCPDLSNFASDYLESTVYLIYTDSATIDYLWRISISNLSYIVTSGNTVTAKVIPDNYAKRPIRFVNCIIPYNYDNRQKDYIDRFTLQYCTNISLQANPIGEGKLRIHGVIQKDDTNNTFRIPYPSAEYVPEKVNEIVPCVTSASQYGTNPSLKMINIGSSNIAGLDTPIANNYYFIDVIINISYL